MFTQLKKDVTIQINYLMTTYYVVPKLCSTYTNVK